ncbi:hypothetical protein [Streptomyces sp. TBY4]|uniref:hypothetical protein n=1 Tax=Streptomyces sp. TBY4 TaxID=2962030 RepID=UPI0020B78222|nr:hypothetical protein [Streptomyces sp. TBY4]MCP3755796.1 hypothetical protein [Streptomyces sp. TBY4]
MQVNSRPSASPEADLEKRITGFTQGFGERGGYRVPTADERRAVTQGVALLLDGDQDGAHRRLAEVDFAVQSFTDSASGRHFAEVADQAGGPGPGNRGWGRVYVDLDARPSWSVQVPHPIADQETERLGARVLRGAPGGVMVLAGAHRTAGEGDSADVAHRTDSVFHEVVEELMQRRLPGIQLHGFANESFPEFDAVISTGAGDRALSEAKALSTALTGEGLEVCRAYVRKCKLAGTSNEQGQVAADGNFRFLHIELARAIRTDNDRLNDVTDAIAVLTTRWSRP